jgi:hypothetical protein
MPYTVWLEGPELFQDLATTIRCCTQSSSVIMCDRKSFSCGLFRKCGTVQIFGNDDNKSKPDSGGN